MTRAEAEAAVTAAREGVTHAEHILREAKTASAEALRAHGAATSSTPPKVMASLRAASEAAADIAVAAEGELASAREILRCAEIDVRVIDDAEYEAQRLRDLEEVLAPMRRRHALLAQVQRDLEAALAAWAAYERRYQPMPAIVRGADLGEAPAGRPRRFADIERTVTREAGERPPHPLGPHVDFWETITRRREAST